MLKKDKDIKKSVKNVLEKIIDNNTDILDDELDIDDPVDDIDDEESENEVDIAEVENIVVEDEEGIGVIDSSPHIEDEDEPKVFMEDSPEDEDEDEDNNIERIKAANEINSDNGKIQVSKEERDRAINRLSWLLSEGRKDIAEKLKTARDFGDLSENAEYEAAKKEQAFIEGEISDLQQRLEHMEIIDYFGIKDDIVHPGNIVEVQRKSDNRVAKYFIVGSYFETDMNCEPKKIATDSPVGGALIGGIAGQEIHVKLPHGKSEVFTILGISH